MELYTLRTALFSRTAFTSPGEKTFSPSSLKAVSPSSFSWAHPGSPNTNSCTKCLAIASLSLQMRKAPKTRATIFCAPCQNCRGSESLLLALKTRGFLKIHRARTSLDVARRESSRNPALFLRTICASGITFGPQPRDALDAPLPRALSLQPVGYFS